MEPNGGRRDSSLLTEISLTTVLFLRWHVKPTHLGPCAHESIATAGDPAALCELLKHGIPQAKDYALWSLSMSICDANQPTVAEAGPVACRRC